MYFWPGFMSTYVMSFRFIATRKIPMVKIQDTKTIPQLTQISCNTSNTNDNVQHSKRQHKTEVEMQHEIRWDNNYNPKATPKLRQNDNAHAAIIHQHQQRTLPLRCHPVSILQPMVHHNPTVTNSHWVTTSINLHNKTTNNITHFELTPYTTRKTPPCHMIITWQRWKSLH